MIEKQWIKYKLLEIVNIFLVYEIILLFVKTQLEQHSLGFRDCFSTFFQFSILFQHSFGVCECFSTFFRLSRLFFDIDSIFEIFSLTFSKIFKMQSWHYEPKKTDQKKLDFVRKRFSLHFFDTTWQRMFPCVVGCSEIVKSVKTKKPRLKQQKTSKDKS